MKSQLAAVTERTKESDAKGKAAASLRFVSDWPGSNF